MLLLIGLLGCNDFTMIGNRVDSQWPIIDTFQYEPQPLRTDILMALDGSCSMSNDWDNLLYQSDNLAQGLHELSTDWQFGIISTDTSAPLQIMDIVTPSTPDLAGQISMGISYIHDAGLSGESALIVSQETVESAAGQAFLRPTADLVIIFVSDEDDAFALPTPPEWRAWLETYSDYNSYAYSIAVVGPPVNDCGAAPGYRYIAAADYSYSICPSQNPDWTTVIQPIIDQNSTDRPVDDAVFGLSRIPDPTTIKVQVDEIVLSPDGWKYISQDNTIVLAEAPSTASLINVVYYERGTWQSADTGNSSSIN